MKTKSLIALVCIALVVAVFALVMLLQMNTLPHMLPQAQSTQTPNTPDGSVSENTPLNDHAYADGIVSPKPGQPVRYFELIAQESVLTVADGLVLPVWTYNGSVPGPEIIVNKGDFVEVKLQNTLAVPVTIHWHGYPLKSAMDGVPGVNQDSVRPGETFTYKFSADIPGTYWYHSHQEGAKQVDKGLYGALIVMDQKEEQADRDYTLILDEWMADPQSEMDMEGMNMNGSADLVLAEEEMMSTSYNIYTVNGHTGGYISPLEVKTDDVVRLRFVNAGYRSHGIHIPSQEFKVISTDGQIINKPGLIRDQIITIAPGERYDVEFTFTGDKGFYIDLHDKNLYNNQIQIPVIVDGGSGMTPADGSGTMLPAFDLTSYGGYKKGKYTLKQVFNIDYTASLGTDTSDNTLKYTINGKIFKELPPLELETNDLVKLTFENNSAVDHPMHLHGHFFEVLSKNGVPISGSPIYKDTLLVKPGEKYIVAFRADNPGNWVQHCHELHHAKAGMMQSVVYTDFVSNYMPDPNNKDNNPE